MAEPPEGPGSETIPASWTPCPKGAAGTPASVLRPLTITPTYPSPAMKRAAAPRRAVLKLSDRG